MWSCLDTLIPQEGDMRGILTALVSCALFVGCGGKNGGDEDTSTDTAAEPDTADIAADDGTGPELECTSDGDCDDSDPCTTDTCETDIGECTHEPVDGDGDGFPAPEVDGTDCGGSDCDDTRDDIYPGAPGVCADGIDQDCDTVVDDPAVHTGPVAVVTDDSGAHNTAIAWSGSEFGITYRTPESPDVYFARVQPDGTTVGTVQQITATGTVSPTYIEAIWWDSRYALAWQESSGGLADVMLGLVSADGTLADGPLLVDSVLNYGAGLSVEDSSHMAISWGYFGGLRWRRVSHSPLALEGTGASLVDSVPNMGSPTSVYTGSEYGIAWDIASSASEIWFNRFGETSPGTFETLGTMEQITTSSVTAVWPSLVWTGSEYAVAWQDTHFGPPDIYMARISPEGSMLYDARVTDSDGSVEPALGWTGSEFYVAWATGDPRGLRFTTVSPDTTTVGEPVTLFDTGTTPTTGRIYLDIVWVGSYFGASWTASDPAWTTQFATFGPCDN
jgi:hypothetical protein